MDSHISKSRFKARALEYFRQIEREGKPLIITDRDRPVLEVRPYRPDPEETLRALRGSVLRYDDPTEPAGVEDWEALK